MKSEKGVSLIEVMVALTVLAMATVGTITAVQLAGMSNSVSREYARAYEAAQEKIAEIRATDFDSIVGFNGQRFPVEFYAGQGLDPVLGRMGIGGVREGYVVVIDSDENPDPANYGRDLEPAGDGPDGVDLGGVFPLDLNGNGNATDSGIAQANLQVIPVYVIIRWRTAGRRLSCRVQLCTFIAREQP